MKPLSTRTRLLVSFAAVAATGVTTVAIAVRVLVPRLFEQRSGGYGNGNGPGGPGGQAAKSATEQRDALISSLDTALLIALAATLVLSAAIAIVMSRRSVRSLERLRAGTRLLADGVYTARVSPPPPEPELADFADDINRLATTLAATETRRAALIGDVAHEMRTPLTTINGYLEGFDDGLFTSNELTDTVRTEVARLGHLAADLAAVSRSEEGRLELDRQPCDLREAVTTAVERLRPQFDAAGVGLVVETPDPLRSIADVERMVQVFTNVIGNALAYTPAGGRVTISATATDRARIAVTDTGRGLAPDDVVRVFERFYRVDPDDHSGGTGIGLTISRAIVRAHGGELSAHSPGPGRGSTFEIVLPSTH